MKMALIEPNIEGYALFPTLSLATLKSVINSNGHEATIIDLVFHKKDWQKYLKKRITEGNPDIIGISVLSSNYGQGLKIAKFLKMIFKIPIVFGGIHTILNPEEIIKNENVDMVCSGEGEEAIVSILEGKPSMGVIAKEDGKIVRYGKPSIICKLDDVPFPDWSDFDLEKYFLLNNNHLPIMASRGCPYNCSYCINHVLRKKFDKYRIRFRSVENIIEEIGLLIKKYYELGVRYLFFYDDTFIQDKNFVLEFCKKFKEMGYDKLIKWNVNVRANLVTEEIIKAMKDAGCYEVRMGIEACNDYIRNKVYNRNMTKKQIYNAVKIIKKHDLMLRLQFILGAPYETLKMMEESFDMAKEINANYTLFPILVPFPGTDIRKVCKKEGLIEGEFKTYRDMYSKPVVRTKYATSRDITNIAKRIKRYQIKKYILLGLKMKGVFFIYDVLKFFLYYKRKYSLETDNLFRFTVNKYIIAHMRKEAEK